MAPAGEPHVRKACLDAIAAYQDYQARQAEALQAAAAQYERQQRWASLEAAKRARARATT